VQETIGQLIKWCESLFLEHHLQRHNDPADEYCLDLHTTYVLGHDIRDMMSMIHFNLSSQHFIFNALRAMKTGWGSDRKVSNVPQKVRNSACAQFPSPVSQKLGTKTK
jgi:hypothetical protein